MGDISILNTFVSDTATDAIEVAKNIYFPERHTGEKSLSIINGNLDKDNRDYNNWDIQSDHIRPNSCNGARMVAQNAPLDYNRLIFPEDTDDSGAYSPIPGAAIEFYLPYAPSLVVFSWQLFIGGTNIYDFGDFVTTKFNINNAVVASQVRTVPASVIPTSGSHEHIRDRIWSGTAIKTDLTSGWHNAFVSVNILDTATGGGGFNANKGIARVRNRNLKVIWFW